MQITLKLNLFEDTIEEALAALIDYIDDISDVAGNLGYMAVQNDRTPELLLVHEHWSDLQSYAAFMNSNLTWKFMAEVGPFIAKMEQII